MLPKGIFDMRMFENMNSHELIGWLLETADRQEKERIFAEDLPNWVAGPRTFRGHAAALSQKADAAKNRDIVLMKEFDQEHASTLMSIRINASYLVMRAHHEKDEGLLLNKGYRLREGTRKPRGPSPAVSTSPLKMTARRGHTAGSVVLIIERDPGAGVYELQYCLGLPAGEESWQSLGSYKKVRIFVDNLQRAGWYYFRVRSHGDNEASPWSVPADVIVG